MTRGDELPRPLIPESEWCRFFQGGRPLWLQRQPKMYEIICPTELSPRDTSTVRNPEGVLEPRHKQNVGGVFLATATQTYASWNDPLQHHKHHLSTLPFSLQRFSNRKLPSVI